MFTLYRYIPGGIHIPYIYTPPGIHIFKTFILISISPTFFLISIKINVATDEGYIYIYIYIYKIYIKG